jgi:3-methyl-2-oxobutanoate hydroxymethyltransferase
MNRITPDMVRKAKGHGITALTAYDYPTARLLDEAGIEVLLVGDSMGMVVLGLQDTTGVTLEDIVHHLRPVSRGVQRALLVADLPIDTYRSPEEAVANAKTLISAGAHAVKLEGGTTRVEQIKAIAGAGVPVMGHIGMLPQRIREEGGYRIKGKTPAESLLLVEDAKAVENAGAFAVVLELIAPKVADEITRSIEIPTIGIGSGKDCDGQILVFHDLVGYSPWFIPKHVHPAAMVGEAISKAAAAYIARVKGTSGNERDRAGTP